MNSEATTTAVVRPPPAHMLPNDRWRPLEIAFWLIPVGAYFVFPSYLVLGSQILIVGLFAVTLDLILGYAGIVSLGHAAFFGLGAYTAGLLAVHGWGEPISGLVAAAIAHAINVFLMIASSMAPGTARAGTGRASPAGTIRLRARLTS